MRDFAQVKYDGDITKEVADYALDLLDVDKEGLDQTDRELLLTIVNKFAGGPVGAGHTGSFCRRRCRNDRGCIRTVSAEKWIYPAYSEGKNCHRKAYIHLGIEMNMEV